MCALAISSRPVFQLTSNLFALFEKALGSNSVFAFFWGGWLACRLCNCDEAAQPREGKVCNEEEVRNEENSKEHTYI